MMNSEKFCHRYTNLLALTPVLALSLVLAACAAKPVKEADSDTDGKFNGSWKGDIAKAPPEVLVQNWRLICSDLSGEVGLITYNGKLDLNWRGRRATTFVDQQGRFKSTVPITNNLNNPVSNKQSLHGSYNLIFTGSLAGDNPSGRLTAAYSGLGNQGCVSKIKFSKK